MYIINFFFFFLFSFSLLLSLHSLSLSKKNTVEKERVKGESVFFLGFRQILSVICKILKLMIDRDSLVVMFLLFY